MAKETPWFNPGKWYVSPYNYAEQPQNIEFPITGREVVIRDSFFSDEVQGVWYPLDTKLEIARRLDEAGVGELFHHIHGVTQQKLDGIKALCKLGLNAKIGAYLRVPSEPDWKNHMDQLIDAGIDEIQIHENTRARIDFGVNGKQEVLSSERMTEMFIEAVEYAKKSNVLVSVGVGPRLWPQLEDFDLLMGIYNGCINAGAEKIFVYLASAISPHGVQALLHRIKGSLVKRVPFGIHVHNDYGLGVACQIAAVLMGATHVEAYVNGMADRNGPPLEDVAVALELFYGVKTGINLEKIYDLCKFVEEKSSVAISPLKGITGGNAFTLAEDKFVAELLSGELTPLNYYWEGYVPEVVGKKGYKPIWDRQTLQGKLSVPAKFKQMGLEYTDEDVQKVKEILNERVFSRTTYPMWVEEPELEEIIRSVMKN